MRAGALLAVAAAAGLLSMAATAASRPRRQLAAQPRPPSAVDEAPPFSITQSILRFTSALGDRIGGGNVVISPFSIVSVLNLLLLGAADNTYEQLRQVLQYPFEWMDLLIHQQSGIQLQSLRRETRGVNVQIANRIFTDSAFAIDREFARQARDFYQVCVPMMFAELTVPFVSYSREGFAAVALPYAGAEYAMVVLMQFSLALRDILQEMGATDLFQESRASLGRYGASAVTTTLVNRDRLATTFRANRPFLFVIRDNKTGVPLFYGRMLRRGGCASTGRADRPRPWY
ncbi:uncharacterized protein LOC122381911 [Amphibalanus amphitrite]|uniref:uncharacterized protein LOC122381911 n=1 Tax=Amphibalanus amphitrite TaxID=1232801 RepID=UPI001C8FB824|nr:uncharacterized protein LOC122381911 [Amphibalanus amphitrite]